MDTGTQESLDKAEEAFHRALELNPDLPITHKLFAQLDVDRGRARDAMARLIERAQTADPELLAGLVTAARLLLENDAVQSIAAVNRFLTPDFKDPEGLFYAARHLARLNEDGRAIGLLERVVAGGFFCSPILAQDPWLDTLRKKAAFTKLLHEAEAQHHQAAATFAQLKGHRLLGVAASSS